MRIMVPLDGSPLSEYAIGQAAFLARQSPKSSEIVLVRIISLTPLALSAAGITIGPIIDLAEEGVNDYLREVTYRPSLAGLRVATKTIATFLGTDEALSEQATTLRADLVVLASHGRSGVGRALLGSVAHQLVRISPVPTLIVQVRDHQRTPTSDRHLTILVPLDESPFAEHILQPAAALAAATHGEIVLCTVLPSPSDNSLLDRDRRERAERYLRQHADHLNQQGVPARISLEMGDPATRIVQRTLKEADPCDVIALATHALPAPERFFVGSVADDVLRHAHCPVLLIHPQETTS